jgi:magnesium chelatase family protein
VEQARGVQRVRFRETPIRSNARISSKFLEQYATPDVASRSLLENAITRMGLSARAYDRILKVSRTIADLANSENIQSAHVAEAIQYRILDRPATT